jgi:hypothetical protein
MTDQTHQFTLVIERDPESNWLVLSGNAHAAALTHSRQKMGVLWSYQIMEAR